MLLEYMLSIDPKHAENGEELGIYEIANTETPAIKIKGVALSDHGSKPVYFADDLKYRIAAPVVVPSKIYRKDPNTGEEYWAVVTTQFIEDIYVDFMAKRMGKQVFNEEHDESKKPPSYILETWLVEDPETDKAKTVYGLDVPKGSWFAVQQFTDKEVYHDYVERGLTGFSIHGHSAMLLMSEQNKTEMKTEETKSVELSEGNKMQIGDKTFVIKDGVPVEFNEETTETEIAEEEKSEEVEMMDEKKEEETEMGDQEKVEVVEEEKEVEMEGDHVKVEEEKEEVEMQEENEGEMNYYSKEEVDAKIAEIYDMVAAKLTEKAVTEVEDEASVQMSEEPNTLLSSNLKDKHEKLKAFGKFDPKNKQKQ